MVKRHQILPGVKLVVKDMLRKSMYHSGPPEPNSITILRGPGDIFGGGMSVSAGEILEVIDPVVKKVDGGWQISSRNGCWYQEGIQVVPVRILSNGFEGYAYWCDIYRGTDLLAQTSPPANKEEPVKIKKIKSATAKEIADALNGVKP
jgi:hypothetical protein